MSNDRRGGEDREIKADDLMDAADNEEQALSLHRALRTMRDNPSVGGDLQEMAREVLSGRIGMKDAIQTDKYMDAMGVKLGEMREAAERQTPEEREAEAAKFERWEREQREEEERERAERDAPTQQAFPSPRRRGGRGHRP